MSEEEIGKSRIEVWGSVQGLISRSPLVRDGEEISAIVIADDGSEIRVKGGGAEFFEMIEAAAKIGRPVIFQGIVLGSSADGSDYISVRISGPLNLTGTVTKIYRPREGERPDVGFWMLREITSTEGETHLIGTGVNVRGSNAIGLMGLREGDRISLQARHGEDGFIATSPVRILTGSDPAHPDEPEP